MGIPSSSPSSHSSPQFKRRVLLINPPPHIATLFFRSGAKNAVVEEGFSMSTFNLLKSIDFVVVSWNGSKLRAEQWLSVLGNHLVVLYFYNPLQDLEDTKSADAVEREMKHQIGEVLESSPKAEVFTVLPVTVEEEEEQKPKKVADNDFQLHDEDEAEKKPTKQYLDYNVISRSAGLPFLKLLQSDETGLFNLKCYIAHFIVPMDVLRPVSQLLYTLMENCDASEAHLLDATTFMPIASADDVPVDTQKGYSSRLYSLCRQLQDRVQSMQRMSPDADVLDSFIINSNSVELRLVWAVRPWCYALVIRQRGKAKAPTLEAGDGLVKRNIDIINRHLSHVINNTTAHRKPKPLKW